MKKILFTRLWDVFISLVVKYMTNNGITQQEMADMVGMQRSHLNALLNRSEKRPLTAYYLLKFIRAGVISVTEIRDNRVDNDREKEFWSQAKEAENLKLLGKIARIRAEGVDFENFLEIHFPNV